MKPKTPIGILLFASSGGLSFAGLEYVVRQTVLVCAPVFCVSTFDPVLGFLVGFTSFLLMGLGILFAFIPGTAGSRAG